MLSPLLSLHLLGALVCAYLWHGGLRGFFGWTRFIACMKSEYLIDSLFLPKTDRFASLLTLLNPVLSPVFGLV